MKITGMAPSRPHTQISDASCLRDGLPLHRPCPKTKTIFKGVDFEHGAHLNDQRRGKKLRCVTCHSQIVQGEHLTITESTCFTCHFYGGDSTAKLADCKICHKQTREKLFIDANENMPFVHKEYVDRGVALQPMPLRRHLRRRHLKDNICVQCHSEPDILGATKNSEEIHHKPCRRPQGGVLPLPHRHQSRPRPRRRVRPDQDRRPHRQPQHRVDEFLRRQTSGRQLRPSATPSTSTRRSASCTWARAPRRSPTCRARCMPLTPTAAVVISP